ncbi:MAG: 16S rRNA (guanine(527)-N(7))-methyltransferase RsmG [Pseudomonadota bacterium]
MSRSIGLNVSRETMNRLELYESLLLKWNPRINLVSKKTLMGVWERHFIDSAQLLQLLEGQVSHWADLGSGGGFPGLVIAILATETKNPSKVTLVESDRRKAVFMKTVLRETGAEAEVISKRIEDIAPLNADVLSARALSDLATLLGYASRHLSPDGTAIFPKGENWQKEMEDAQSKWQFQHRIVKSKTSEGPVIICARGVSSV